MELLNDVMHRGKKSHWVFSILLLNLFIPSAEKQVFCCGSRRERVNKLFVIVKRKSSRSSKFV